MDVALFFFPKFAGCTHIAGVTSVGRDSKLFPAQAANEAGSTAIFLEALLPFNYSLLATALFDKFVVFWESNRSDKIPIIISQQQAVVEDRIMMPDHRSICLTTTKDGFHPATRGK